ncbi:hypothetical protein [Actinoplanes couchii]|uniref:Uncharacterized protein n=1 Tax=Actinoplanes couchii TaxID=403638 RepID=A0ABQ3XHI4_9ACTN|nr:hypothetical protein [Actinoplanes couchii]MDR6317568.1 hypothetical protein [Actinoplanes couchii]GID57953.1 hypothetical protein Aco03nite_063570 [Actinoplanes couchii]
MATKRKNRNRRVEPAPPPVRTGEPVHWWFAGLGGVLLAALIGFGLGSSSTAAGDALAAAACWVTGCHDGGLAVVGWMLVMLTLVFGLGAGFSFRHCGIRGRIVLLVLGTATLTVVFLLAPDPRTRMTGDGSTELSSGMLWGIGTLAVGGVLLLLGMFIARVVGSGSGIVPGLLVFATLVLGGIFTYVDNHDDSADAVIMTTHIFPEVTMRLQGDDLTRVSATDLQGCAGRYQGCEHTAEFQYTTTDSDAVVDLEIIWFPSAVDTWNAWDSQRTVNRSADGTSLRVSDQMHEHLMISTVRHADGRVIAAADEKWLRWPAAQLHQEVKERHHYKRVPSLKISETAAPLHP